MCHSSKNKVPSNDRQDEKTFHNKEILSSFLKRKSRFHEEKKKVVPWFFFERCSRVAGNESYRATLYLGTTCAYGNIMDTRSGWVSSCLLGRKLLDEFYYL